MVKAASDVKTVKKAVKKTHTKKIHPKLRKEKKPLKEKKIADGSHAITKKRNLSKRFNKLKVKASDKDTKGTVYVGHLPKGFNEDELKKFFEQFGKVTKYRVSRSSKVLYPPPSINIWILDRTCPWLRLP